MERTPILMTMEEAAATMRISRRSLQEIVKRHPYYVRNGRRKLFAESDIVAILDALLDEGAGERQRLQEMIYRGKRRSSKKSPATEPTLEKLKTMLTRPSRQPRSNSGSGY